MRGIRAATWAVAMIVIATAVTPAAASQGVRRAPQGAAVQPVAVAVYRIRAGDTLWGLARRHRTTAERLATMNGIALEATLQIGQRIRVPVVRGAVAQTAAANSAAARGAGAQAGTPARPARLAVLPSRGQRWATALTALATRHVGVRYRWGGTSPSGFDCSGFLYYVFGRNGVALPRTTFSMFRAGVPVPLDQIQTGDVVFFQTLRPGPSHAGIYLGDGRFVHSSSGSGRVTITPMGHRYYGPRYLGARRF
ncbi:MAG: peptidoglycan endopeptidase [bacterium]|nr:peptidoglycan endopeptidase [bacterium]